MAFNRKSFKNFIHSVAEDVNPELDNKIDRVADRFAESWRDYKHEKSLKKIKSMLDALGFYDPVTKARDLIYRNDYDEANRILRVSREWFKESFNPINEEEDRLYERYERERVNFHSERLFLLFKVCEKLYYLYDKNELKIIIKNLEWWHQEEKKIKKDFSYRFSNTPKILIYCYIQIKEFKKAEEFYLKLLEEQEKEEDNFVGYTKKYGNGAISNKNFYLNMAEFYRKIGKTEEIEKYYEKASNYGSPKALEILLENYKNDREKQEELLFYNLNGINIRHTGYLRDLKKEIKELLQCKKEWKLYFYRNYLETTKKEYSFRNLSYNKVTDTLFQLDWLYEEINKLLQVSKEESREKYTQLIKELYEKTQKRKCYILLRDFINYTISEEKNEKTIEEFFKLFEKNLIQLEQILIEDKIKLKENYEEIIEILKVSKDETERIQLKQFFQERLSKI